MKKGNDSPSLIRLLLTFMKLGLFSFGGGATMLTLIHDELVTKKNWLNDEELLEMTAIAESTPGPIAINLATYLGYKKRGWLGSIFATLGVVIPTFAIMFAVALLLANLMQFKVVQYAFMGIKCGVVFLIIRTAIILSKGLKGDIVAIIVFALVAIAMTVLTFFAIDFSAIYFILIGGLIGIIFYALLRNKKGESNK